MSRVTIYSSGPLTLSVCAPKELTAQQVIDDVESQHPCGTTHGWHVSDDEWRNRGGTYGGVGEPMGRTGPIACNEHPEGRIHWLLTA